uniref:ATP synthase complex subunit 8 n=1 Tax=Parcoblatta fulvescens TaxID=2093445 RepID=A0A2P1H8S8_9NEOP|nr:ATP synthase F0 subunit 8 [Parcoblatta fulvescens]
MPQMMPLSWLLLYMYFCLLLLLFNSMNFYSHIPTPVNLSSKKIYIKIINWKW